MAPMFKKPIPEYVLTGLMANNSNIVYIYDWEVLKANTGVALTGLMANNINIIYIYDWKVLKANTGVVLTGLMANIHFLIHTGDTDLHNWTKAENKHDLPNQVFT